jgi:hypothetical protein
MRQRYEILGLLTRRGTCSRLLVSALHMAVVLAAADGRRLALVVPRGKRRLQAFPMCMSGIEVGLPDLASRSGVQVDE